MRANPLETTDDSADRERDDDGHDVSAEEVSMRLRLLIPTAVAVCGLALSCVPNSVAAGIYSPQSPRTVPLKGTPCWVDTYGPVFPWNHAGWSMRYGADVACATGVTAQKTLRIWAQVAGQHRPLRYFTIFGSGLVQGPTPTAFLRLHTERTAYLGHGYRIVVVGSVTLPDGRHGHVTVTSGTWAP
jgi:hypothetical protein